MTRPHWPLPPTERTLHVIGDIQTPSAARRAIVTDDMTRGAVPDLPHRVTVGDFVNSSTEGAPDSAYTPMVEFINSLGAGQWWSVVGNHDAHGRTPDESAELMGMPSANFVVDLGYVVLVCMWVRCSYGAAQEPGASIPTDTAWLATTLAGLSGRTVAVVSHAPLWDPRPVNSVSTENAALLSIVDANPCVKAWICGHTHVNIEHQGIVHSLDVGSRTIAHINGSALVYTDGSVEWYDRLCSLFVTFNADDSIDVRFRDHGAHRWVGGGVTRAALWTHPAP